MAQILLKLCQGHLSDETKWKAPYNHGSKVHHSLVRAISIFSLVHFCWWDLVKIRTGHPGLLQQNFFFSNGSDLADTWPGPLCELHMGRRLGPGHFGHQLGTAQELFSKAVLHLSALYWAMGQKSQKSQMCPQTCLGDPPVCQDHVCRVSHL